MNKKELLNYKNNNEYINKQLEEYNYTKELLRNKHTPDRKLEKEYKKIFKRLTLLRVKLNKVLKVLDNMENTTHRNILYNIYIAGMSAEETALDLHYDYKVIQRKKHIALEEFEKTKVVEKSRKK